MQRKLIVLTTFLFLFLVIGCSDKTANQDEPAASSSGEGATTEFTLAIDASYEEFFVPLVERYEEQHPEEIDITLNPLPINQLREAIEVQMSSGEPSFDGLFIDNPLVSSYSSKGFLAPLDEYINDESQSVWVETALEDSKYNNQLMAAPLGTSSHALFYNTEVFEEYGVTPPSRDERWTWEQVADAAKQVKDGSDGDVYGLSFRFFADSFQFLPMAQSLGAQLVSDDGLTATGYTNSPEAVEAYQFYYDLYNTWGVSPIIDNNESIEYFTTGKIAMLVGDATYTDMFMERDVPFDYAPYPYFEGHEVATPTGSYHIGVSAFTDKTEAVAEFIKYVTVEEGSHYWFELRRQVPANKEVIEIINSDPEFDKFPGSVMRIMADQAENTAAPRPRTPGFLEWTTEFSKALNDISNGADPQEALDNAAQQTDRLMEKYHGIGD